MKKQSNGNLLLPETLLCLKKLYPNNRFEQAHKTFTKGEESPLLGGLANGVGNLLPEIPFIKCGTAFVKKMPAENAKKQFAHSIVSMSYNNFLL